MHLTFVSPQLTLKTSIPGWLQKQEKQSNEVSKGQHKKISFTLSREFFNRTLKALAIH